MFLSVYKKSFVTIQNYGRIILTQRYNSQQQTSSEKNSGSTVSINNVTGLTRNCVDIPKNPVGPGASKNSEYKNPEYFCYNTTSFAEAEVEMAKFRLPAPSNKKKSK